jgi:hypothetical protein
VLRVGLLVLLACALACARASHDAALIRVDGVEQALERPSELLLRGDGFPQGMRGEAHIRGALYPVGREPRAVDLRAPCRALGTQKASVELEALAAQLPAEGPFEGLIEVRFGSHREAQLLGRIERALFRLGTAPAIEEQFSSSQRAERFQRSLGIHALDESEGELRVAEVSPESAAGRAGLMRHDRVLRVDGRPIQLARDLVAVDTTSEVLFEVRRAHEASSRLLRVATAHAEALPDLMLIALASLLGIGLGAVLVSALPSHMLWAPHRREYWLLLCCAVCSVGLGALIVRDVDPLLARMSEALSLCAAATGFIMYLRRRITPTLRTSKDPDLAPLL